MSNDPFVVFDTSLGDFVVDLYSSVAPLTVANFLYYVDNPGSESYAGSFFSRLVPGFVLQGGGYAVQNGTIDTIPTAAPVQNEYNPAYPNVAGTIALAKLANEPDSGTDEFFFNLEDNSSNLDNQDGGFTVFGSVVENFSVLQKLGLLQVTDASTTFPNLPIVGTLSSAGAQLSNLVTFSVAVVTPIANTATAQPVLDDGSLTPFAAVVLTDPGNPSGAGDVARITIENASGTATAGLGTFTLRSGSGLTLTSSGGGVYTTSAAGSITALQSALQSLVWTSATTLSAGVTEGVTLDVTLITPGGTLDNSNTSLVISHDPAGDDTITGADGVVRTLSFGSTALAALAGPLLSGVVAANALFVDSSGVDAMSPTQTAVIDDATGATTITGNSASNETVAAGAGAVSFTAGSGSGTIVMGSGDDSVYLPGGGNWRVALGNGADTAVAATGNDTISTGVGGSFVFLGSGASSVTSSGADTILGGTGSATITASSSNNVELFALGAPLSFIAGTGASTVVAGAVAATLFGGATGGTLAFTDGNTDYVGSGAADTLVGLAGSMTVQGGAGGGLFFGGAAGSNSITAGSGNTTAIAGGAGDVLTATGSASDLFAGGTGAETLTGAGSSGANTFFAGFGPETLIGGAGSTALVAGAGADLLTGGSGATLFLFVNGRTVGASDTISGWDPTHDFVMLSGYATSEASVVQAATLVNGSSVIALADGTNITFAGVTSLSTSSFT